MALERLQQKYNKLARATSKLKKAVELSQTEQEKLLKSTELKRHVLKRLIREQDSEDRGWRMTDWEQVLETGWVCFTIPREVETVKKEKIEDFSELDDDDNENGDESEPDILPSLLNKKKRTDPPPLIPEIEEAKRLLHILFKNTKIVWPFEERVDPIIYNIPDYPLIVKKPMDLGTVREKLHKGAYINQIEEFVRDVRLVFTNATLYNNPHHEVYRLALQCSNTFEKKLEKSKLGNIPLPIGLARNKRWNVKINWRRAATEETICWGAKDLPKEKKYARKPFLLD